MGARPVRAAVLGAGFISDYHIAGLREAGAELVAVSSATAVKAREKAERYGIPHHTANYREILARDDVEAVVVATPDFTHEEVAVAAARAGKAILLQKPMARTSAECLRIIEAAQQAQVLLCVSFMHRYFGEIGRLKDLLAQGALGDMHAVRQRNATSGADWAAWVYRKADVGGGVVLQLGVHGIDLLRYLFGEIVAVTATTALMTEERVLADGTRVTPNHEDQALALYRFASGALAVHEMSYTEVAGTDRFRLEVYGARGTAWVRTERGRLALYAPGATGQQEWVTPDLGPEDFRQRHHRHFLAMVSGEEPPDSTAWDGLATVLVAEAIYRAAESGNWEAVGQP